MAWTGSAGCTASQSRTSTSVRCAAQWSVTGAHLGRGGRSRASDACRPAQDRSLVPVPLLASTPLRPLPASAIVQRGRTQGRVSTLPWPRRWIVVAPAACSACPGCIGPTCFWVRFSACACAGLLLDTEHDRVLWRRQIEPDHVGDLGRPSSRVGGELERLGLPRLDPVLLPDPRHRGVLDTAAGRPARRLDQCRHPQAPRRRCQARRRAHLARSTRRGRPGGSGRRPDRPAPAPRAGCAFGTVGRVPRPARRSPLVASPSAADNPVRARCATPAATVFDRTKACQSRPIPALNTNAAAVLFGASHHPHERTGVSSTHPAIPWNRRDSS